MHLQLGVMKRDLEAIISSECRTGPAFYNLSFLIGTIRKYVSSPTKALVSNLLCFLGYGSSWSSLDTLSFLTKPLY